MTTRRVLSGLLRRIEATRGRQIRRLAASTDGQFLYFDEAGYIWSVAVSDGTVRKVTAGDAVAVDPAGRFLLVQRAAEKSMQVVRRDPDGKETALNFPTGVSVVRNSVWPAAIHRDGRFAVVVQTNESWFWRPAVFDLNTGRVQLVPVDYPGDIEVDFSWDGDRIAALARRMEGALWRFERHDPLKVQ